MESSTLTLRSVPYERPARDSYRNVYDSGFVDKPTAVSSIAIPLPDR
jgi:hypothetical protein